MTEEINNLKKRINQLIQKEEECCEKDEYEEQFVEHTITIETLRKVLKIIREEYEQGNCKP